MDIGAILLLGFLGWVGWKMLKSFDKGHNKHMYCTTCGHDGDSETKTRGSMAIEVALWLCFVIPGLIYSMWRQGSRQPVCAKCGGTALVPPDSPVAMASRKVLQSQ
jgi:hypothetical protein